MAAYGVNQAFSHAIYLISLGSENEEIVEKSIQSLASELDRCETLALTHTIMHPGASGRFSTSQGIVRIGDNIKKALSLTTGTKVKLLLENTAGGGSSVGGRIEHLAELIDYIKSPRIGLCIDTCHAFCCRLRHQDYKRHQYVS